MAQIKYIIKYHQTKLFLDYLADVIPETNILFLH
jgi:hypothetical protein